MKKVEQKQFTLDDGSPTKLEERVEYLSKVAGFFADIMRPKVEHLIYLQHQGLANPTNTRDQDFMIKANINALSLLLDWGDESEAELQSLKEELNNKEE